jgi:REP element-mobilizing transposase RayT
MICSRIGDYARECWKSIPDYSPFVELDSVILMPDHLHGIICIDKKERSGWNSNKFGPQHQNLASIIRGYKSAVSSYSKSQKINFQWHSGYYDRIIRNEIELEFTREYIRNNPAQWKNRIPP